MSADSREFEQNMGQLLHILKKIISNLPPGQQLPEFPFPSNAAGQGINLNLCFFTFLPISPEDLDELEEFYDQHHAYGENGDEIFQRLNPEDLDFLRRHGIRFN